MRQLASLGLFILVLVNAIIPAEAAEKYITIGTAGERGIYYPAGGAICRFVQRGVKEHGIRCFVEPTGGSVYNLKALKSGDLDLAFAQTDWIYHAYKGGRNFNESGPDKSLRSVFSLHTEAFTVLARDDSGIRAVKDLKHKRIGVGSDDSGMQATAIEFLKAEGLYGGGFSSMREFRPADIGNALCAGTVEAILITTGHPNGGTEETTGKCATHLVAVEGPEIDRLIQKNPYYLPIMLPGRMYRGSPYATPTFGLKATLVTTSDLNEEIVYQLVKAVFENLDDFKALHPVFASLNKTEMVSEGLIVSLHPGALRYYREVGLIK